MIPVVLGALLPLALAAVLLGWTRDNPIGGGYAGCAVIRSNVAQLGCYEREFAELVDEQGVAAALARIESSAADDQQLTGMCHRALHRVGADWARRGTGIPRAVRELEPGNCADGFLHGFLLASAAAQDAPGWADACPLGAEAHDERLVNCAHVRGHALTRTAGVAAASKHCTRLPGAGLSSRVLQLARDSCDWGAFMELAFDTGTTAELARACTRLPAPTRERCFQFLPVGSGLLEGRHQQAVADTCRGLDERADAHACAAGFGAAADSDRACRLLRRAKLQERCLAARASADESQSASRRRARNRR